ncbi:MAG: Gfo/Idh/MocA family oxidoreductase [Polyangiaceae bacterium]
MDAVYIASPHPFHERQALAAIAANKAVLCEKPIAMTLSEAERIVQAARTAGVFLMEAFMYRCHPLLREARELLLAGAIGEIVHVNAQFGFRVDRNPSGRLFAPELGGGAILDVGGYPASFARLVGGIRAGQPFAEPVAISATGRLGPTGVDELAVAQLVFASGMTAEIGCATRHSLGTQCVVYGEKGRLELPNPWLPRDDRLGLDTDLHLFRDGHEPERRVVHTALTTYAIEAQLVADTLPALQPATPAMTWDDTLGNMRLLQAWSDAVRASANSHSL